MLPDFAGTHKYRVTMLNIILPVSDKAAYILTCVLWGSVGGSEVGCCQRAGFAATSFSWTSPWAKAKLRAGKEKLPLV